MQRSISVKNNKLEYSVRRHKRARNVRVTVNCDATVVLTVPYFVSIKKAESFLFSKAKWIIEKVELFKKKGFTRLKTNSAHYLAHKERALGLIIEKIKQLENKLKLTKPKNEMF